MPVFSKRFLIALSLLGMGAGSPCAGDISPPVPFIPQDQTNWCWAASDQMVHHFYSDFISQCAAADFAGSRGVCGVPSNCCGPNYPLCNQQCDSQIGSFKPATLVSWSFSWSQVETEVNANRPFIFMYGSNHMAVAAGTYTLMRKKWLKLQDPAYGTTAIPQYYFPSQIPVVWYNIQ